METMSKTTKLKAKRSSTPPARSCHECNKEALGRCPLCHKGLCLDHFPRMLHAPCAQKYMKDAQTYVCYVCGAQVNPDQWSLSQTSHRIDNFSCKGCGRYICDQQHTKVKKEQISVIREGLRGHLYQVTSRYCALCAPISSVGGIKGLSYLVVFVGTVIAGIFFYFHP
jgi:hypothetical protein